MKCESGFVDYKKTVRIASVFLLVLCACMLFVPASSYAYLEIPVGPISNYSTENHIVSTICRVIMLITGPMGQSFMILVLIMTAITMLFGKVTWMVLFMMVCGMGTLFGAQGIVNMVTGGNVDCRVLAVPLV